MEYIHIIADWLVATIDAWGYPGIFLLMTIESSFFPLPSEIVMIPAGYNVGLGNMDFGLVVLAGTLGSILGAIINYYLAYYLGRPIVLKIMSWVRVSLRHFERVETYFHKHGEISTFVGRLIPGIRQLISLPAGLVKMPLWKMNLFTALGAGIWVIILTFIGFIGGKSEDVWKPLLKDVGIYVVILLVLLIIGYIIYEKKGHPVEHKHEVDKNFLDLIDANNRIVYITDKFKVGKFDTFLFSLPGETDGITFNILMKKKFSTEGALSKLVQEYVKVYPKDYEKALLKSIDKAGEKVYVYLLEQK